MWLLEELGVAYEIKHYQRDPKTMLAPAELKAVHPLGKSPVITDGDRVVAESGAIVEYLLDTYDPEQRLRPAPGTEARHRFTYWLHYAEGSAMPPLLLSLIFSKVASAPAPFFVKPVLREVSRQVRKAFVDQQVLTHVNFIADALGRAPWLCGEHFSAADVQMSFPIEAAVQRSPEGAELAPLRAFCAAISARPAYQRALARGGPYDLG